MYDTAYYYHLYMSQKANQRRKKKEKPVSFPIKCVICGEIRPYAAIGVFTRPLEDMPPGSTYNVHYCLDKTECVDAAPDHNPFSDMEKKS